MSPCLSVKMVKVFSSTVSNSLLPPCGKIGNSTLMNLKVRQGGKSGDVGWGQVMDVPACLIRAVGVT